MRALHAAIDDPGSGGRDADRDGPAPLKIQRDFPLNFPKSSLLIQSSDPHRGQMAIWLGLSSRLRRNQVEVLGWVRRRCKAQHVSFCRARSGTCFSHGYPVSTAAVLVFLPSGWLLAVQRPTHPAAGRALAQTQEPGSAGSETKQLLCGGWHRGGVQ